MIHNMVCDVTTFWIEYLSYGIIASAIVVMGEKGDDLIVRIAHIEREGGHGEAELRHMVRCGRERGGSKEAERGVCPDAQPGLFDGIHDGELRGHVCRQVTGTFCDDDVQGDFAHKVVTCSHCDFFLAVEREEGDNFHLPP